MEVFIAMDVDRDGVLSRVNFPGPKGLGSVFQSKKFICYSLN